MTFDVDAYMAEKAKIQRDRERQDWGATCPHCGADVLSSLKKSAYEWGGYGPPSTTTFECPDCEKELVFELEWSTELWRASLLTENVTPPEPG